MIIEFIICSCPILFQKALMIWIVLIGFSSPASPGNTRPDRGRCDKEKEYGLYRYKWKIMPYKNIKKGVAERLVHFPTPFDLKTKNNMLTREQKLEAALRVSMRSLRTYGAHPVIENQVRDALKPQHRKVTYTCSDCTKSKKCEFSFDDYNTNGDCLAGK